MIQNCQNIVHYQYFGGTDLFCVLNLSPEVFQKEVCTGATFMSSIFNHCTSIHIWVDKHGVHLTGPKNMHNISGVATIIDIMFMVVN